MTSLRVFLSFKKGLGSKNTVLNPLNARLSHPNAFFFYSHPLHFCFSSSSLVTGNRHRAFWLVNRPADLFLLSYWEFCQGLIREAINYAKTLRWWRKSAPSRRCSGSSRSSPPPPSLWAPPAVHLSEVVFLSPPARGSYISDSFQVGGISSTVNQLKLKWWMSWEVVRQSQRGEGGAKAVTDSSRTQQMLLACKVQCALTCV